MTNDILIVDDNPTNLKVLASILEQAGHSVRAVTSGEMALRVAQHQAPALILLDIMMGEMDGYETCQRLKENEELADIPVIFLSALDDPQDKVTAFEAGGVDYVTKPFNAQEVLARVQTHLDLQQQRQEIAQLYQAERDYLQRINALKDDLLQMVTHDLKNPLGAIIGANELVELKLRDHPNAQQTTRQFTTMIDRNAERMLRLIGDLLDMAFVEDELNIDLERVSMKAFLQGCFEDMRFQAEEKGITFTYQPFSTAVDAIIDPQRFEQIVHNLLSNAIKYTPEGGSVTLAGTVDDAQISITVTDTGLGIPATDVPHLFDRFYRVQSDEHQQASGTGIGLSIVKMLVEQHGGEIHVESEEGSGSTFTVTLPTRHNTT